MTATKGRRHGSLTMDRRRHDGPVALMVEILEGTADLRGAACTARPRLFDPDVEHSDVGHTSAADRWREVRRTCQSCPARAACWAWATEVSSHRAPSGPTAASVISPFRRHLTNTVTTSERTPTCVGRECDRPRYAMDLCSAHYSRYLRNPDQPRDHLLRPLTTQRRTYPDPAPEPPRSRAKRGARARIKPSINRKRQRNNR